MRIVGVIPKIKSPLPEDVPIKKCYYPGKNDPEDPPILVIGRNGEAFTLLGQLIDSSPRPFLEKDGFNGLKNDPQIHPEG